MPGGPQKPKGGPRGAHSGSVVYRTTRRKAGAPAYVGKPRDIYTTETCHVVLCSTGEDDSCGLDSDRHGEYVELCFAAEVSKVVLSDKQRRILDFDRVATMRVYVTAAAKRASRQRWRLSYEGVKHHQFEMRINMEFAKNEKGEMERAIRLRLAPRAFMDLEALGVETFSGKNAAVEPEVARQRGIVQEAVDHGIP
eukprot:3444099-Pyramimonas_sp.AAC.1